jgi:hypothetical protein
MAGSVNRDLSSPANSGNPDFPGVIHQPIAIHPRSLASGSGPAGELPQRQSSPVLRLKTPDDFTRAQREAWHLNRAPTPPGEREEKLDQLDELVIARGSREPGEAPAKSRQIGFGIEGELMGAYLKRLGLKLKSKLGEVAGYRVETDESARDPDLTYLEFIQKPEVKRALVRLALLKGLVHAGDTLFDLTFAQDRKVVRLGEFIGEGVSREFDALEIEVHEALPLINVHATSGAPNESMPAVYEPYLDPQVRAQAERAMDQLERKVGLRSNGFLGDDEESKLSPNLRGFLMNTAVAAIEAGMPPAEGKQTPHAAFVFCNRTAYSLNYLKYLSDDERSFARAVLRKPGDRQTLLSQVLQEAHAVKGDGDARLFSAPYLGNEGPPYRTFPGPTRDEFFESITRKLLDDLSNLEGSERDGVGGWIGGDDDYRMPGREQRSIGDPRMGGIGMIPALSVLEPVVMQLYGFWAQFNPRLDRSESDWPMDWETKNKVMQLSTATETFNEVYRQAQAGAPVDAQLAGRLDDAFRWLGAHRFEQEWSGLQQAHREVMDLLRGDPMDLDPFDEVERSGPDALELRSGLKRLGFQLFDCDHEGAGRRERQAQEIRSLEASLLRQAAAQ